MLIVAGAVVLGLVEWSNPRTLGPLGLVDKLVNSLFASITPRSAGFASLDMRAMRPESDTVTTLLMFIGSASGSTGGGIKVNTVAVLILVVLATAGAPLGAGGVRAADRGRHDRAGGHRADGVDRSPCSWACSWSR